MSRSYQKYGGWKDRSRNGTAVDKRRANKAVRHYRRFETEFFYQKIFNSYDIHDYNFRDYHPFNNRGDRYRIERWPPHKFGWRSEIGEDYSVYTK